jgi:hypothetical protein
MLRDRAAEHERRAAGVESLRYREALLYVAARLRALADEDEMVLPLRLKADGCAAE